MSDGLVIPSFAGSFVTHLALLIATAAALVPQRVSHEAARSVAIVNAPGAAHESMPAVRWAPGEGDDPATGDPEVVVVGGRHGINGPPDNPDPHLSRAVGSEAESCGCAIGLTSWAVDSRAPPVPWGRDDSLGRDDKTARGRFEGDLIDDAGGELGLGWQGHGASPSYVHRCRLQ